MRLYEGTEFPFANQSHDYVTFIDVLHHTADPIVLMQEAKRVARKGIVIKDHLCDSWSARRMLIFMDWVGNRQHGVALPNNFWSTRQWNEAWSKLGTKPDVWITSFGLYPGVLNPLFEGRRNFIARLPVAAAAAS
jgi:SAM-dependent methyltransferase